MKKRIKTLLSILSFLAFAFIAFGSLDDNKNTENDVKEQVKEAPALEVSSSQLYADYEANGVAADQKYKGKVLKVTGTVNNIDKDIMDQIYITLNGNNVIGDVQCFFSDDYVNEAAQLQKGQKITVIGKCEGKLMNVMIKGCSLEK